MSSYVISISLGTGCYRHIQIAASATLYKLHQAILNAFDFDDDHLHAFFMDNKVWSEKDAYYSMKSERGDHLTKRCRLESLGLSVGDKFKYLFDFGDEWTFQCKVLRILEETTDIPRILRSVGESPEQYPDFEDDWDEDWEDDADEEDGDWEDDEENWEDEDEDWDEEDVEWEDTDGAPRLSQETIDKLYSMVPLKKSTITCIRQYFAAAERFYGAIPLKKLHEIFNRQNIPIPEDMFLFVAEVAGLEGNPYLIIPRDSQDEDADPNIDETDLVSYYLLEDDVLDYLELYQQQGTKPYKILPKQEFLRYAEEDYYPTTPENVAMLSYLRRRKSSLSLSPEEFCIALQDLIAIDVRLQDILSALEPEGLTFDGQWDIEEFLSLYQALNNNTPKHVNRGFTPNELFSLSISGQKEDLAGQLSLFDAPSPLPKTTITGAPARNAPCPCGSGKKYKNCCGKR